MRKYGFIIYIFKLFNFYPGAYAPLTSEGNIIIDGVLASCYADLTDHDLAHISIKPFQWFPEMMKFLFGEENGRPSFLGHAEELGNWLLPYDYALQY